MNRTATKSVLKFKSSSPEKAIIFKSGQITSLLREQSVNKLFVLSNSDVAKIRVTFTVFAIGNHRLYLDLCEQTLAVILTGFLVLLCVSARFFKGL